MRERSRWSYLTTKRRIGDFIVVKANEKGKFLGKKLTESHINLFGQFPIFGKMCALHTS